MAEEQRVIREDEESGSDGDILVTVGVFAGVGSRCNCGGRLRPSLRTMVPGEKRACSCGRVFTSLGDGDVKVERWRSTINASRDPVSPPPRGKGGHPVRFFFTYADLAKQAGCSIKRLQNLRSAGVFNPKDFASVAALLRARSGLPAGDK